MVYSVARRSPWISSKDADLTDKQIVKVKVLARLTEIQKQFPVLGSPIGLVKYRVSYDKESTEVLHEVIIKAKRNNGKSIFIHICVDKDGKATEISEYCEGGAEAEIHYIGPIHWWPDDDKSGGVNNPIPWHRLVAMAMIIVVLYSIYVNLWQH